jgi:hypothetical protein
MEPSQDSSQIIATQSALLVCALALGSCLGPGEQQAEDVGSTPVVRPLFLTKPKWPVSPSGIVQIPVCFDQNVANADPSFAINSVRVRIAVITTWSKFAKIDFTGWGTCPTNRNGMIVVHLINAVLTDGEGGMWAGNTSPIGYPGANAPSTITIDVGDSNAGIDVTAVHEFGHGLGFAHEFARSDFSSTLPHCSQAHESGNFLDTPPDSGSIMAAVYCTLDGVPSGVLSFWDVWGVQIAYGARYGGLKQLASAWNASRTDYSTVAAVDRPTMDSNGYKWLYSEGWIFDRQAPQTVPLQLYWNASRNDYFTTATADGINSAIGAGYTFVRTEGYVYQAPLPEGTIYHALNLYWNAASQDNFTTANDKAQTAALAAGYIFVRTEGYILDDGNAHFDQTWRLSGPHDTVSIDLRANPPLAALSFGMQLLTTGWSISGPDAAVLREPLPGTSLALTYWNQSTGDYVMLANAQDQARFSANGYGNLNATGTSYLDQVGYLFDQQYDPSTSSGIVPFWLYSDTSSASNNFTTAMGGFLASPAFYPPAGVQGFGLARDPMPTAFNASNVIYDHATMCNVGGISMHCCPDGYAMIGADMAQDVFKCAQPSGGLFGSRVLGTGATSPNTWSCGLVSFGEPSLMVGFSASSNTALCQASATLEATETNVGYATYVDRCTYYDPSSTSMHVCPHVPTSFTTTGFMAGYNQGDGTLTCLNPANFLPAILSGPACNPIAYQSSSLPPYDDGPEKAVDGNTDENFWDGSVTHTYNNPGEWWEVDLEDEHTITGVTIWNRFDCCSERLTNFDIEHWVWGTGWVTDMTSTASTAGVSVVPISLDNVSSEWLLIRKTDSNYLSLAEVQVWGF